MQNTDDWINKFNNPQEPTDKDKKRHAMLDIADELMDMCDVLESHNPKKDPDIPADKPIILKFKP